MKLRMAGLAVLAALGGGAAVAATGFGDGSSRGPDGPVVAVKAHRVTAPHAVAKSASSKSAGTKLIYKETPPQTVTNTPAPEQRLVVGRCPLHSGVINGYYLADNFEISSVGGGPTPSARKWELDIVAQPATSQVIFGIVCLKP